MVDLKPPHRRARPDDADAMAELVNLSGDGFPLVVWGTLAAPGQSAWDVGLDRARRGLGGFAPENTVVLEVDGAVAGCLIGYPQAASPLQPGDDTPRMLAPLLELAALVDTTWYLNVLAIFPEHRRRGHASTFLALAEAMARETGTGSLSLITSDANHAARQLYARHGFVETATRPMVKGEWVHDGTSWVLLAKAI